MRYNQEKIDSTDALLHAKIDLLKMRLIKYHQVDEFIKTFQKSVNKNPIIASPEIKEFLKVELKRFEENESMVAAIKYESIFILKILLEKNNNHLTYWFRIAIQKRRRFLIFELLLQLQGENTSASYLAETFFDELGALDITGGSWLCNEEQEKIVIGLIKDNVITRSQILSLAIKHNVNSKLMSAICSKEAIDLLLTDGYNVFQHAIKTGNYKVFKILLSHHPDLKARTQHGESLLYLAFEAARERFNNKTNFEKMLNIINLLIDHGVEINFVDSVSDKLIYLAEYPQAIKELIDILKAKNAFRDESSTHYHYLPQALINEIQYYQWWTCHNFQQLVNTILISSLYSRSHFWQRDENQSIREIVRILSSKNDEFYAPKRFDTYLDKAIKYQKLFWLKIFIQLPFVIQKDPQYLNRRDIFLILEQAVTACYVDGVKFLLEKLPNVEASKLEKELNRYLLIALKLQDDYALDIGDPEFLASLPLSAVRTEDKINNIKLIIDLLIFKGAKLRIADLGKILAYQVNVINFLIGKKLIDEDDIYKGRIKTNIGNYNLIDYLILSKLIIKYNIKLNISDTKEFLKRITDVARRFPKLAVSDTVYIEFLSNTVVEKRIYENKELLRLSLTLVQVLINNSLSNLQKETEALLPTLIHGYLSAAVYSKEYDLIQSFLNQSMAFLKTQAECLDFIGTLSEKEEYLYAAESGFIPLLTYNTHSMFKLREISRYEQDQKVKLILESFLGFLHQNLAGEPDEVIKKWSTWYIQNHHEDPFVLLQLKTMPSKWNFILFSTPKISYQKWFDDYLSQNPKFATKDEINSEKLEVDSSSQMDKPSF